MIERQSSRTPYGAVTFSKSVLARSIEPQHLEAEEPHWGEEMEHTSTARHSLVATLAAMPLLTLCAAAPQAATHSDRIIDHLIIKYKTPEARPNGPASSISVALARAAAAKFGLDMLPLRSLATGAHLFILDRKLPTSVVEALAAAVSAADPTVEYAEPDYVALPAFTPNDPSFSSQWHYHEPTGGINLPSAWDQSTGNGVVVAVVDTGYRPHIDLAGNLLPGYDFVSDLFRANDGSGRDADASDPGDARAAGECASFPDARVSTWHGTHVAGTIAALTSNSIGVSGIAFAARVLPIRALGKCGGSTSDIAEGIIWAAGGPVAGVPTNTTRAKVVNLSLGAPGACSGTYQSAINTARSLGAVVVVAANNFNSPASNYQPGNCLGVVTVAATARNGGKAPYSNFGVPVDLAAPGGFTGSTAVDGVLSTDNSGTSSPSADVYAFDHGTSFAAPHVSGTAALVLSLIPALASDDVELILRSNTRAFPTACSGCGTGILNAAASVTVAGIGSPLPPSSLTSNPASISAGRSGSGTVSRIINLYTVRNGKAPFRYQWQVTNGFNLGTPTSLSTTVSAFVQACDTETATVTVTVTDAISRAASLSVPVQYSATAQPGYQCP